MTKPSEQQTTNTRRASLLRLRAEDEPTMLKSSSMTSESDRPSSRFVGCRGDSPGLSAVAERRGFVSVSEQFPRTAERPGVATPQRSKPLAPPSWGGEKTYDKAHKNIEGVRGRTRAGTGAGTSPDTHFSKFVFFVSVCFLVSTVSRLLTRLRTVSATRVFSPSHKDGF